MQNKNKKKICIVVSSLGKGGAERSSALLSVMLSNLGHEVHIITILNHIDYKYKGVLLNLGALKDKDDSIFGRFKRFLLFKRYIKINDFDLVIDNRTRSPIFRELCISLFIYKLPRTIFVVRSFEISKYFPSSKNIVQKVYGKAFKIIGVSKEISEKIKAEYKLNNVSFIYNPIGRFENEEQILDFEYILAYGRLKDEVKNFSLLIEAYHLSSLKQANIKLVILGDGKDRNKLINNVRQLGLEEDVLFFPFVENPSGYIKKSKYVCLTSRFEGFPRVLTETLSLGVPVVSVNCKSGPKEIINHRNNGLLVENYNAKAFAEAMDSFIFDKDLYAKCVNNAKNSVSHLSLEAISLEWESLINMI